MECQSRHENICTLCVEGFRVPFTLPFFEKMGAQLCGTDEKMAVQLCGRNERMITQLCGRNKKMATQLCGTIDLECQASIIRSAPVFDYK